MSYSHFFLYHLEYLCTKGGCDMPKDRENELVQFILQYMLEHQFENKSDMARQLSMESRTVQRTFERLNAGTAKGSAIILNRVLLFCAERSVSMDNLFQEFNSLHEPPPVDNVVNEDTDHPIYIKICLHKPAGLTTDGERMYRYIGEFLQKASNFLCSQCSHWRSPEHDSIFFSSECPIYQMACTMITSLNENHTEGGRLENA